MRKPVISYFFPLVEVSGPGGPNAPGVTLGERDVCVGWVYGQPSVCVLRHPASPSVTAALDVYTQNRYDYISGFFFDVHLYAQTLDM